MEARRKRIGERLERHPNYKVLMKKLETIELTDAKFDEIVETSKKIELDIELDITKEVEQYRIQLGSAQQHFNQLIVNMQLEDNRMQLNDVFVMHKRIIGLYEQYLPTRLTSPESVKVIEVDDGVSAKAAAGGAGRFTAITQSSYLQLPVVDSAKSKGP